MYNLEEWVSVQGQKGRAEIVKGSAHSGHVMVGSGRPWSLVDLISSDFYSSSFFSVFR